MDKEILKMASELISSYVSNNSISPEQLLPLLSAVFATFESAAGPIKQKSNKLHPAVPIKDSVTASHVICLEDGKKLRTMTRYLRSRYGLSPDDYRERWGLPSAYPMVAPDYADMRSAVAKKSGLGRNK